MDTYVVTQEPPKMTLKERVSVALSQAVIYTVLMVGWRVFWPIPSEHGMRLGDHAVGGAIGGGAIYGIVMFFWYSRRPSAYNLLVGEDSMTAVYPVMGLSNWCSLRATVHQGKIRTFVNVKSRAGSHRGLYLSDKSKWIGRLTGATIFIPNTLPEYEDLRRLAESWRVPGTPE